MYAEHFKEKIKLARIDADYTQQQVTDFSYSFGVSLALRFTSNFSIKISRASI